MYVIYVLFTPRTYTEVSRVLVFRIYDLTLLFVSNDDIDFGPPVLFRKRGGDGRPEGSSSKHTDLTVVSEAREFEWFETDRIYLVPFVYKFFFFF